jgi:hypothetical protein
MRIGGDLGGTIYLSGGHLAFAESAAAPDLGSGWSTPAAC